MFEYLESAATDIINELNKCVAQMEKDAQDYEKQAKENERQAEKNISDAKDLEGASYMEEVPYQDEDGTTKYRTEENTAKKNAAMKKAADLKAEAIKLRINAGILRGLASIIRNGKLDILSKAKLFDNAVESVNRAISNTNTLLSKGASEVSLVISRFCDTKFKITGITSTMSFYKAKEEAKELYINYLLTLDNYSGEEKNELLKKFCEQIDNVKVLSDAEFTERFAKNNPGVVAVYNGPSDRAYIREGYEGNIEVIMHEVGGHGTGTMCNSEGYWYTDPDTGRKIYAGDYAENYEDFPYPLEWLGSASGSGMNEATTEYFARKISGKKDATCAYNAATDALEIITENMTKNCGINGEELLFDTYVGEDKGKFGRVFNEIMNDDKAYDRLDENMRKANNGNLEAQCNVLWTAVEFSTKSSTDIQQI